MKTVQNIHNSFFFNSHKLETSQRPINRWMSKHFIVYTHYWTWLSTKKQPTIDTYNSMGEYLKRYDEEYLLYNFIQMKF